MLDFSANTGRALVSNRFSLATCPHKDAVNGSLPDDSTDLKEGHMRLKSVISHLAVALFGASATWILLDRHDASLTMTAQAQTQPQGQRSTELFNQVMDDVLGRRLSVRLTEREPGNGSPAHRHPGSYTVGYILEGTYEVKIDDGPLRQLVAGDVFYEPPNALHAVSRNASNSSPVKYLVIQVSDATKPATVVEK